MMFMPHHMDVNCGDKPGERIPLMQQKTFVESWLHQEEGHKEHACPNQGKQKEQPKSALMKAEVKWCDSGKGFLNCNAFERSVSDK